MANRKRSDVLRDRIKLAAELNANQTYANGVTRGALESLCESMGVSFPYWITNDPNFKTGRNTWRVPTAAEVAQMEAELKDVEANGGSRTVTKSATGAKRGRKPKNPTQTGTDESVAPVEDIDKAIASIPV